MNNLPKLIAIEGLGGCGKTTVAKYIAANSNGEITYFKVGGVADDEFSKKQIERKTQNLLILGSPDEYSSYEYESALYEESHDTIFREIVKNNVEKLIKYQTDCTAKVIIVDRTPLTNHVVALTHPKIQKKPEFIKKVSEEAVGLTKRLNLSAIVYFEASNENIMYRKMQRNPTSEGPATDDSDFCHAQHEHYLRILNSFEQKHMVPHHVVDANKSIEKLAEMFYNILYQNTI